MIDELKTFEEKAPEIILIWNDTETEAQGWLVINSLKGGAAGGGTRMKAGINVQEVLLLAKTMELKFTVTGPRIGGAKSGINFDPTDPRKDVVLKRWYKAISPMLKNCYGTGGDLNVDFIKQVIPLTKEQGILHPQEGILQGHYRGVNKEQMVSHLLNGASKVVQDTRYTPDHNCGFTVADLISGYSTAESVYHYYKLFQDSHVNKRAIIQGWGNVGSSAGYYLTQLGVKVVGILDMYGGVFKESGFDLSEIRSFLLERKAGKPNAYLHIPYDETMENFWSTPAEIFVPAAASRLITKDQLQAMIQSGIELIACGANVPFADEENFFGPIAEYADNTISVIPDFIANCGMARVFAYLMQDDCVISDESIFKDVSETVRKALLEACDDGCRPTEITQTVYRNALKHSV